MLNWFNAANVPNKTESNPAKKKIEYQTLKYSYRNAVKSRIENINSASFGNVAKIKTTGDGAPS